MTSECQIQLLMASVCTTPSQLLLLPATDQAAAARPTAGCPADFAEHTAGSVTPALPLPQPCWQLATPWRPIR